MNRKQRFFVASVVGALTWALALFYIFGYNVYMLSSSGAWVLTEPPRALVMLVTMLAMAVSYGAWRWYKQDRVERALSGLNAQEKEELRTRLTMREGFEPGHEDYDVVLTPRKRKLEEE
ncbi:MAG: hypothetical protein U0694_15990 [Anaerolineae bacterium]